MTSRISYGARMVRVEDGQMGVMQEHQGELRIFYEDRGERLVASKAEKWDVFEPGGGPLRDEEKRLVALTADKVLRAIVRNEPSKLWEPVDPDAAAFDEGLVRVVVEYLGTRA